MLLQIQTDNKKEEEERLKNCMTEKGLKTKQILQGKLIHGYIYEFRQYIGSDSFNSSHKYQKSITVSSETVNN